MNVHATTLSRFTPSLMPQELLERLFVARERTLDSILDRVDAATTGSGRNHTLLVGPRGSGKTHLVSLVYHRVQERRQAGAALQVAWLPEDPWTIVSYRHLLAAVAERLEPSMGEAPPRSAGEIEALLTARAAEGGPIVVLVENLDQILHALGNDGQQRLRHLLQARRPMLLVATSTRLDRSLSDQASPFYGFFTTTRLEPFDVDEASAMLTAIAEERDDSKLVEYLASDEGRARLRVIAHLAGGQPRMWATLASALTVGGLDELVQLLLTRFDDLTPYYQEQLGRLAPQQRLVVAELAEADRPINVRELAERLEIDQRSLGKTMTELVERGWATPTTSRYAAQLDKRRTYYELAEPLARLSFQIKESRGEPLRLVVEFLKHWFDPTVLGQSKAEGLAADYVLLAVKGHEGDPVVAVTRRLRGLPASRVPTVALLADIDDALATLSAGDPEPFLRLPVPVRAALEGQLESGVPASVRVGIHQTAQSEFGNTRHPSMTQWITRAEELVASVQLSETMTEHLLLARWLGRAWRFDEAAEALSAAVVRLGTDSPVALGARADLAVSYFAAGHVEEAIRVQEAVLVDSERYLGPDHPDALNARTNVAMLYSGARRVPEAIELQEAVHADCVRILGPDHPDTLKAWANLAASYSRAGRTLEAIELNETVLARSKLVFGIDHPITIQVRANLAVTYWEASRVREAIELEEAVLIDRKRLLGSEHPDTLRASANLAVSYSDAGRVQEAIKLEEDVLADSERILGSGHPDTSDVRGHLAFSYRQAGREDDARALEEGQPFAGSELA